MNLRISCLLLTLLVVGSVANAQIMIYPIAPQPPPSAANSLAPKGNIPATAFVPLSITFRWRHGGLYATMPQPAPASYFIVCVYDAAAGENCNNTPLRWVRATSSLSRIPVTNPYSNPPQIVVAYDYSLDVQTLDGSRQDKALAWNVLACTSMSTSTCTAATAVPLRLSTKNLRAENIQTGGSESNRQGVRATAVVSNTGTTDSGQFDGRLEVWEVFYDVAARSCRTDLNGSPLPQNASVITATGATMAVSQLPRNPDGSFHTRGITVSGIFVPGMAHGTDTFMAKLAAGANLVPLETEFESPTLPHDANSPTDRAAWVMFTKFDTLDTVKEFDELDNHRVECKHF